MRLPTDGRSANQRSPRARSDRPPDRFLSAAPEDPGAIPSPEDLAALLREGLDARRATGSGRAPAGPTPDSLRALGDLTSQAATGGSTPVRAARRLAAKLAAPWLARQSDFNRALLEALDAAGPRGDVAETSLRLDRDETSGLASPEARQRVLVATHLPPGPGIALVVSGGAAAVEELRASGHEVVRAAAETLPSAAVGPGAVLGALAFGDGGPSPLWSDGGRTARERLAAMLAPEGVVLGSGPSPDVPLERQQAWCGPLRIVVYEDAAGFATWVATA
jgi:hypothetical protein